MARADDLAALNRKISSLHKRVGAIEQRLGMQQERVVRVATPVANKGKESSKPVENLGFKVFGTVGFFLILLSLFYLYRYAVNNGWLGVGARVALGVLFSIGIIALGEGFRRKSYSKFSQLITGGGVGLLYFTVYATYHFEHYRTALGMSAALNTFLLFIIMAFGVALALRQDALYLTCFSFLLCYTTALLMPGTQQSIIATILITTALCAVIWKKRWPVGLFPVITSYIIFLAYSFQSQLYSQNASTALIVTSIVYLLVFFALFTLLAIFLNKETNDHDVLISVINAFAFYALLYATLEQHAQAFTGLCTILLGFVYLQLYYFVKPAKRLASTFLITAVALFSIAIPVQLDGAWVTLLWTVEGALLVHMGVMRKSMTARVLGYCALMLATVKALCYDTFTLEFGYRTLSYVATTAALYLSVHTLAINRKDLAKEETFIIGVLTVLGTLALTVLIWVEVIDSEGLFGGLASSTRQVLLSVLWAVEAIALIIGGFVARSQPLRVFGVVLFGITVLKVLLFDLGGLPSLARVIVTMLVGIIALAAAFFYVKNKDRMERLLQR